MLLPSYASFTRVDDPTLSVIISSSPVEVLRHQLAKNEPEISIHVPNMAGYNPIVAALPNSDAIPAAIPPFCIPTSMAMVLLSILFILKRRQPQYPNKYPVALWMTAATKSRRPMFKRLSRPAATITAIIITLAAMAMTGMPACNQLALPRKIRLKMIPAIIGKKIIYMMLIII